MTGEQVVTQLDYRRVEIGARAAALVLVFALSMFTGTGADHPSSLLLLAGLGIAASLPVNDLRIRRWRPAVESLSAALLIATSNPYDPALLPYLVVPSLSAGLIGGWTMAVITAGAAVVGLLSRGLIETDGLAASGYLVDISQWSLLALAFGLLAAWLRRVQTQRPTDTESYAEAAKLLSQLRDLSRQLSGGLDAVGLAQSQLAGLRDVLKFDRGWVFTQSPGGLLVLLATDSPSSADWEPDLHVSSVWSLAWDTHEPHRSNRGFTADPTMCAAVLPLRIDDEVVGLVGVERRAQPFEDGEIANAQRSLDSGSVRIDAALLFNELRTLATTEERRRLAREIHDGIAQELASLGYAVDDLSARAAVDRPDLAESLRDLRGELTRVISELRLSIFDLRREIGPGMSLVSALSEHVRTVGATSGLTVHLELAESPRRLRVETETELLRIAQEAIANARRHADAKSIWVTCRVDPPQALLRVEDDGKGLAPGRSDSFGLDIMRERADRAGGTLEVSHRAGGGTSVEVRTPRPAASERRSPSADSRPARR
ncbi:MAG: sensor histidine kinase [Candidatus Nanopelagicales bacterium]